MTNFLSWTGLWAFHDLFATNVSNTMPSIVPCYYPQIPLPPVQVPGVPGASGPAAYTSLTIGLTVPAVGASVTITVGSALWAVVGMSVIIGQGYGASLTNPGPAAFKVTAVPTSTTMTVQNVGSAGSSPPGASIDAGAVVTPSGGTVLSPQSNTGLGFVCTADPNAEAISGYTGSTCAGQDGSFWVNLGAGMNSNGWVQLIAP
jgi:hypothetical protein